MEPGPAPEAPDVLIPLDSPRQQQHQQAERDEDHALLAELLEQLPTSKHFDATMGSIESLIAAIDPDGAHLPFEVRATRAMLAERLR